jgi:glycosyltransferase involved in cell wall biosynthesis
MGLQSLLPRSAALRTAYSHHANNAGYKTILEHTKPQAVFGKDERIPTTFDIRRRYLWLYEFEVARYARKNQIDLVHILYAEEYYRFLGRLIRRIPIVATFHQPEDLLLKEVTSGGSMGRVSKLAHALNRNRFSLLAAAIVMTPRQKDILAMVMPADRIHVIPLGVDSAHLTQSFKTHQSPRNSKLIITVGNWQRDWEFYFATVEHCRSRFPEWQFVIVNKKLPSEYRSRINGFTNITFRDNVGDKGLHELYLTAAFQFLPLLGAAGNNALNESLALGCPVVTNVAPDAYRESDSVVSVYPSSSVEAAVAAFQRYTSLQQIEQKAISQMANERSREYDWSVVASQALDVYRSVL